MKGAVTAIVASALLLGSGVSGVAWAQKKRVVIEQFSGPGSDKFRAAVIKALDAEKGVDLVADKKVAQVEADLGLIAVSDSYAAVARELKASAFVGGTITGKKPRAKLVVRNADGSTVGEETWTGANAAKLQAAMSGKVGPKVVALVAETGGPPSGGDKAEKAEKKPAKEEATAVAAAEEKPKKKAKANEEDEWQDKKPAREESASNGESSGSADVEARASADDEEPSRAGGSSGRSLEIALLMRIFSRNLTYNENARPGAAQSYKVGGAPAPGVGVEFSPLSILGVGGSFNYVVGTASKDTEGSVYETSAYQWEVHAKGKIPVGPVQLEPEVGYGGLKFAVKNFDNDPNRIKVAGVDYKNVRAGGGVRLPFGNGMSLVAGGYYLHIMSAGEILDGDKFFFGKAMGGEGFAGLNVPLSFMPGLQARVGVDIRRIAFAFDVSTEDLPTARPIAGGAVDQYLGLNLALGYALGL